MNRTARSRGRGRVGSDRPPADHNNDRSADFGAGLYRWPARRTRSRGDTATAPTLAIADMAAHFTAALSGRHKSRPSTAFGRRPAIGTVAPVAPENVHPTDFSRSFLFRSLGPPLR